MNTFLIILIVLLVLTLLLFNTLLQLIILWTKDLSVFQKIINTVLLWSIPVIYGILFYWSYRQVKKLKIDLAGGGHGNFKRTAADWGPILWSIEMQTGVNPASNPSFLSK